MSLRAPRPSGRPSAWCAPQVGDTLQPSGHQVGRGSGRRRGPGRAELGTGPKEAVAVCPQTQQRTRVSHQSGGRAPGPDSSVARGGCSRKPLREKDLPVVGDGAKPLGLMRVQRGGAVPPVPSCVSRGCRARAGLTGLSDPHCRGGPCGRQPLSTLSDQQLCLGSVVGPRCGDRRVISSPMSATTKASRAGPLA